MNVLDNETIINEATERVKREKNVFIKGVVEVDNVDDTAADFNAMVNMLKPLLPNNDVSVIVSATRIGKSNPAARVLRLIKVVFNDSSVVRAVLRNKVGKLNNGVL